MDYATDFITKPVKYLSFFTDVPTLQGLALANVAASYGLPVKDYEIEMDDGLPVCNDIRCESDSITSNKLHLITIHFSKPQRTKFIVTIQVTPDFHNIMMFNKLHKYKYTFEHPEWCQFGKYYIRLVVLPFSKEFHLQIRNYRNAYMIGPGIIFVTAGRRLYDRMHLNDKISLLRMMYYKTLRKDHKNPYNFNTTLEIYTKILDLASQRVDAIHDFCLFLDINPLDGVYNPDITEMLLMIAGIESNPGPSELNGDTRRDGKTRKNFTPGYHEDRLRKQIQSQHRNKNVNKFLVSKIMDKRHTHYNNLRKALNSGTRLEAKSLVSACTLLCSDETSETLDGIVEMINGIADMLGPTYVHITRVLIRFLMMMNVRNEFELSAHVADLILAKDSSILLDATVATFVGKAIMKLVRYNNDKIYCLTSDGENIYMEYQGMEIDSGIIATMASIVACLVGTLVLKQIPTNKDLDSFINRCHTFPRAFNSISQMFATFKNMIHEYLIHKQSPLSTLMSVKTDSERFTKFTSDLNEIVVEMNRDGALLDTSLAQKTKELYESHLEFLTYASTTKNRDLIQQLRNFSPILHNIYTRVMKTPGVGVQYRQEPCAVLIHGAAGVGKTNLIRVLSYHLFKDVGVTKQALDKYGKENFIFSKQVGQKYWTNYNSLTSMITHIDDANQINLKHVEGLPFPGQFISLKNSAPCPLEVAECELKQHAMFNSKLIFITDNIKMPDINDVIASEEAYVRRMDLIVEAKTIEGVERDFLKFSHLKFDVDLLALPGQTRVQQHSLSFQQLLELIRSRISYYKQIFHTTDDQGSQILDEYFPNQSDDVVINLESNIQRRVKEGLSSAVISTLSTQMAFLLIFQTLRIIPFNKFFQFLWCFIHSFVLRRRGLAISLAYAVTTVSVSTFKKKMKTKTVLTVTAIFASFTLLGMMLHRYFKKEKELAETKMESYSNLPKQKKFAKSSKTPVTFFKPESFTDNPPDVDRPVLFSGAKPAAPVSTSFVSDNNMIDIATKVLKNQYLAKILLNNQLVTSTNITILKGQIAITNWHFIKQLERMHEQHPDIKFILQRGVNGTVQLEIAVKQILKTARVWTRTDQIVDCCLICLGVKVPTHADITKYLVSEDVLLNIHGAVLMRQSITPDFQFKQIQGNMSFKYDPSDEIPAVFDDRKYANSRLVIYYASGRSGDCGSPVFMHNPASHQKIAGFHCGSVRDSLSIACNISSDMVATYERDLINIVGIKEATLASTVLEMTPESRTLPMMEDKPSYPVGSYFCRLFTANQTKYSPSILHDEVEKHINAPAKLSGKTAAGVDVFEAAISKNLNNSVLIDEDTMLIAQSHIQFLCTQLFDGSERILTWEETIKGGYPGLNPIPRSTSPGVPYVFQSRDLKGKQSFLGSDQFYKLDDPFLLKEVASFKEMALQNVRKIEPFAAQLKDETRDLERVALGKTRAFMACNLTLTCILREIFGSIFAQSLTKGRDVGMLPGMNYHSDEVNQVVRYITEVAPSDSESFGAGDFSNFDGTLNEQILQLILHAWIDHIEMDEDQLKIALIASQNVYNAIYLIQDQLFMNTHSLPSGCPATTILNTWYNSTICAVVICRCLQKRGISIHNYRSYYRLLAFGDDNLFALHPALLDDEISDDITHFMSTMGMTYTDGSKHGKIVFGLLADRDILKRGFKFNKELYRWTMPLRKSVILEVLNWDKKKTTEDKIVQLSQNLDFVFLELALHGREIFEYYYKLLMKLCASKRIPMRMYSYQNSLDQTNEWSIIKRWQNL